MCTASHYPLLAVTQSTLLATMMDTALSGERWAGTQAYPDNLLTISRRQHMSSTVKPTAQHLTALLPPPSHNRSHVHPTPTVIRTVDPHAHSHSHPYRSPCAQTHPLILTLPHRYIIRNTWKDGLGFAHNMKARGSHSAAFFMQRIGDLDEAIQCPNPSSPRSWFPCADAATCALTITRMEVQL